MATTNYWDNVNPLSILDVKPTYQLPTAEIMNTLQKRTSYFMQGAQKFKNNYDAAEKFGFNLLNNQNKKEFQVLNNEANAKLKDASSSNLENSDTVNNLIKLYDPIVRNENFQYDEAVKNTVNKTFSAAQSDAAKKNNTSGYNVSVVAYNKEMQDMFSNDDPTKAKYYLNDKFLGAYWEAPDKVQTDLLKNTEKQFAKTKEQSIKDPNNPYSFFQVKQVVIEKDDVKNYLMENRPEVMRNQNEVNSRLELLHKQKTQSPEKIQEDFKTLNERLIDDKIKVQNAHILNLEQNKLYVYKTEQEKINADNNITDYKTLISNLEKRKKDFDYSVFSDKSKIQDGFTKYFDIYDEIHTSNLAGSIARTVSESSQLKTNQGAYYQDLLRIKKAQAAKDEATATGDFSNQRDPNAFVNTSNQLSSNKTNEEKGKDVIQQSIDVALEGINKATLGVIRSQDFKVKDGGRNINLVDFLKDNANTTKLKDLKQLMIDADSSLGESKYNDLLLFVKNAYNDNEMVPETKNGITISSSPKSNVAFENLTLSKIIPRLQDLFTNPQRFMNVAHRSNNFKEASEAVTNMNVSIQEGVNAIQTNSQVILKVAEKSGLLTPEQQKILKSLPASEIIDIDKLPSKIFDYSGYEAIAGRKLTNEEKYNIYSYKTNIKYNQNTTATGNQVTYNTTFNKEEEAGRVFLRTLMNKNPTNYSKADQNFTINAKIKDFKKQVYEKIGIDGYTPQVNTRYFTVTEKDKFDPNRELSISEVRPLLDNVSAVQLSGETIQAEEVNNLKAILQILEPKDYDITFNDPKSGSPDGWATISLKKSALDSKTVQDMEGFDEIKKFNNKIRLQIPLSTLQEKNIFARSGQDKDVMEIKQNGIKDYPLPDNTNLHISFNDTQGGFPNITSDKEILLPFKTQSNNDIAINVKAFKFNGTNQESVYQIATALGFRSGDDFVQTLRTQPREIFKQISKFQQAGMKVKEYIDQYISNPSAYFDENKNISLIKLEQGLVKEKGREAASQIISDIKKYMEINTPNSINFGSTNIYQ